VLKDPGPGARLARLGADGLEYELLFWIADPGNGQLNVRSDVNVAILKALRAHGIDIPYPQRVVHLQAPPAAPVAPAATSSSTEATG
jgi:small-conductance mechanosensitive channel